MDILTIIISSGLVALLTSTLSVMLMIGRYREKVDTCEKNINKHDDKIVSIIERVCILEGGIDRDRAFIKRKSPLSLTESGKAVLLDSKGKDYVDDNLDNLISSIKSLKPKTAYDVQEYSRKIIEEHSNEDSFNDIKTYAFKEGMRLELIMDILGIYLRDKALTKLGFQESDLDK